MAKDHSFDIVSEVDFQEVLNALEQTKKEVAQRFDFKGSNTVVDFDKTKKTITLTTESEMRLKSLTDILETKMAKRHISLKALEFGPTDKAAGGSVRQEITIVNGISIEKAKEIVKRVKQSKLKVQAQIQKDQVRVQSAKIDTLQDAIQYVKSKDFGVDLQFINYR